MILITMSKLNLRTAAQSVSQQEWQLVSVSLRLPEILADPQHPLEADFGVLSGLLIVWPGVCIQIRAYIPRCICICMYI